MAVKDKDTAEKSVVTRISARDTAKPAKKARHGAHSGSPSVQKKRKASPLGLLARIVVAIGAYFKGAWYELRQVRWPNRRATWGMTGALLGFTAFFVVFILLIDALFEYLFKLVIG